jgi:hypothetical protein
VGVWRLDSITLSREINISSHTYPGIQIVGKRRDLLVLIDPRVDLMNTLSCKYRIVILSIFLFPFTSHLKKMNQQPVIVMNTNMERQQGHKAQLSNIQAGKVRFH